MKPCINLKKTYPQYRITYDPACTTKNDPWMQQIPCEYGTIYPHGDDCLAVEVDYHDKTANRLMKMPGLIHLQYGDREHTFCFQMGMFKQIAKVVKPRRKRTYSKATLERLRATAAKARATREQKKALKTS